MISLPLIVVMSFFSQGLNECFLIHIFNINWTLFLPSLEATIKYTNLFHFYMILFKFPIDLLLLSPIIISGQGNCFTMSLRLFEYLCYKDYLQNPHLSFPLLFFQGLFFYIVVIIYYALTHLTLFSYALVFAASTL